MDPAIIKIYRGLLRNGFHYAGTIENPEIYLDSIGENIPVCGKAGQDYVHIYLRMQGDQIVDMRYMCNCDPTANVVFEILCELLKGKTIADFQKLTPDDFYRIAGTNEEEFTKRIKGSLELIKRGITRYSDALKTL
jgi:NifU-like protein involved in Fe-S cluster formation